jgi:hypothetical protein
MTAADMPSCKNHHHQHCANRQWTQHDMCLRRDAADDKDQKERSDEFNDTFA